MAGVRTVTVKSNKRKTKKNKTFQTHTHTLWFSQGWTLAAATALFASLQLVWFRSEVQQCLTWWPLASGQSDTDKHRQRLVHCPIKNACCLLANTLICARSRGLIWLRSSRGVSQSVSQAVLWSVMISHDQPVNSTCWDGSSHPFRSLQMKRKRWWSNQCTKGSNRQQQRNKTEEKERRNICWWMQQQQQLQLQKVYMADLIK